MSYPFDLSKSLESFSGRAPLFPLPEVAFFPNVLLPLHIFEPRYRQMTADALDGDRHIAMAQLKPGWERRADRDLPPIYDYVCLGRITAEERLADGRYYLILQGLARARVLSEETTDLPYRVARLELRPDRGAQPAIIDRENRRREILEAFRDLYPRLDLDKLLHEAADVACSLGVVCDVVAASLRLPAEQSQEILAEEDVDLRSDLVLARLRELRRKAQGPPRPKTFPPEFSA
ncbi:MAG TPA: LON peptidase substrate-binding domain-containing protein, partial [Planctomycetaceae bacterium]